MGSHNQLIVGVLSPFPRKSMDIDLQLEKDRKEYRIFQRKPKLLVLGSGDSGKTTLLRQMQLHYGKGIDRAQKQEYRVKSLQLVYEGIGLLVQICQHYNWPLQAPQLSPPPFSQNDLLHIHSLRKSQSFLAALDVGYKFNLVSNFDYLLDRVEHFNHPNYEMTDQDMLMIRVPTSGITMYEFVIDRQPLIVYDVGGQRGLRKQWVPFFDHVNCILFVTDLSSFDQRLEEDRKTNRLVDAIELFQKVSNNPLLRHCNMILFLNKIDLLHKRLKIARVQDTFTRFKGKNEAGDVCNYFGALFKQQTERRTIVHPTCCVDTKATRLILNSVIQSIIERSVEEFGF
ncbi:guanine nucleotide binding protein, alpha subunit [Gorgonomyces haynaldii]|nr:guanine nucleotide binding protein, alpha subunit [Gorgonomyces haynaldii]